MKIFFEEYKYPADKVEPYFDKTILNYFNGNRASISCVGYYYSSKSKDTIFILPKVFINIKKQGNKDAELAFGLFPPTKIIDTREENNPLVKSNYYAHVFNLSTWLYRAIAHFKERNPESQIVTKEEMLDVNDVRGTNSATWVDIILRLIRFNNEHQSLFTYIAKVNAQGYNRINWQKTIQKELPIIQDECPIYLRFRNKTKVVNFDEELIVLFYSVLDYIHASFNFKVRHNVNYKTSPREVDKLINSGKGTRLLKSIRKKYFKDELVELWNLLYVFFQKAQYVRNGKPHSEFLLARNFNIVFEDMIDSLISDDTKENNKKLKDQPDGKIVDHIYDYRSLINYDNKQQNGNIYYIGDSKYYKEGDNPGPNSVFKQFTYVRNVIQMNMDIWKPSKDRITRHNYYDKDTEGYNITPNFFIRGKIDADNIDYNNAQLEAETDNNGKVKVERKFHHLNRIFDRDTLFVQKYDINFLYVLTAYAKNNNDEDYKKRIRDNFRKNLLDWLSDNYRFLLLKPKKDGDNGMTLEQHFHKLLGKVFTYRKGQYLMGLDLGKGEKDKQVQEKIWVDDYDVWQSLKDDFIIEKFDIKTSKSSGLYEGEKLNSVAEDDAFATELHEYKTFEQVPTELIDKYGKKYFGMESSDWLKIIQYYFIKSAKIVDLSANKEKDLPMAANSREGSFDPHQTKE